MPTPGVAHPELFFTGDPGRDTFMDWRKRTFRGKNLPACDIDHVEHRDGKPVLFVEFKSPLEPLRDVEAYLWTIISHMERKRTAQLYRNLAKPHGARAFIFLKEPQFINGFWTYDLFQKVENYKNNFWQWAIRKDIEKFLASL